MPEALWPAAAILVMIMLLLLSALTSGAEVAFFSLTPADLAACSQSKSRSERLIPFLLHRPRKLLATILVLDSLINIAFIMTAVQLVWHLRGEASVPRLLLIPLILALLFCILFFGEAVPKAYATKERLSVARLMAPLLKAVQALLSPVSGILLSLSSIIEKRYQVKAHHLAVEELQQAIQASTDENSTLAERNLLKGIVNFGSITVRQIMRSRSSMVAFSTRQKLPELFPLIRHWNYSRVPVYDETPDKIEGILYVKDLLPYLSEKPDFRWQDLIRPPFFVPETKKIDELLREFQEKHVHMAIAVNEYGVTAGLVTMEDVIEEIVGEITDEFDEEEDTIVYTQLDEHTFIFDGRTSIHDFCKITGTDYDLFSSVKRESESLGGLLLELFGRMPQLGQETSYKQFTFTVESVDNKRIKRLKAHVAHP